MSCKFIENVLQPIFCALVKLVFVLMRLPFFDGNVVAAVVLVCGVYKRHVIESKRNAINGINIHIISISVSSLSMELRKKKHSKQLLAAAVWRRNSDRKKSHVSGELCSN